MKKNLEDVTIFRTSALVQSLDRVSKVVPVLPTGKKEYCNLTFTGGGAWYIPAQNLSQFWLACAEMLLARHPIFINEIRSSASPDIHTSFFLDFDGHDVLSEGIIHLFILDVVTLIQKLFTVVVAHPVPDGRHALVFAIKCNASAFGCHVVLNSVLVSKLQSKALARVAHAMWQETGWSKIADIDQHAISGIRTILSNKTSDYPVVSKPLVRVDTGRAYDVMCTFHCMEGIFAQSGEEEAMIFDRPWKGPFSTQEFKTDDLEMDWSSKCVVSAKVLHL